MYNHQNPQLTILITFFTTMKPLTSQTNSMLRLCPRQRLLTLPAATLAAQRRGKATMAENMSGEYDRTPSFQSPFKDDSNPTTKIPSFAKYMSKRGETSNKTFQYFMVGTMGLLSAAGAKATVQGPGEFHWILSRNRA